ncbi:tRNA (adenosine(37)-N6)-threonylcarbamoyltransferase complex dimerization subunit type 1 TsaB [Microbacterium sp. P07]|uniref:tRNA (adenosine(37)-N6)-threonylcarbamoyltransferase complex dimerization subunit type 1 TsaB n=1 Tax=Microbacterium sp. P07 TaxID=3366952 RepID=UPI0037458AD4
MFLAIDTSLGTSVAVVEDDGVIVAEASSDNPLGHAEVIGDLLARVVGEASAPLTHVASGMGPGPFTGLRVGIAAARTFALGRALPVVPVPSHDAVALGVLLQRAIIDGADAAPERFAVVTDARRREFAYSVFEGLDDDGLPVRTDGPALAPRDDLDGIVAELRAVRIDAASVPATMIALMAARAVAARRKLTSSEPLYLRTPDVTVGAVRKRVRT